MGATATLPHVRCLSCGTCPETEAAPVNLRSKSERFAFAHCPHCNCLRMMSLERSGSSAARKRSVEAAAAAS
jgi:hypothetical protein